MQLIHKKMELTNFTNTCKLAYNSYEASHQIFSFLSHITIVFNWIILHCFVKKMTDFLITCLFQLTSINCPLYACICAFCLRIVCLSLSAGWGCYHLCKTWRSNIVRPVPSGMTEMMFTSCDHTSSMTTVGQETLDIPVLPWMQFFNKHDMVTFIKGLSEVQDEYICLTSLLHYLLNVSYNFE